MKKRREDELFDKLSEIDGDLIDEAYRIDNAEKLKQFAAKEQGSSAAKKHTPMIYKRMAVAAACLLLAVSVLLGGNHLYGLFNGEQPPLEGVDGYPPYYPSSGDGTISGKPFEEPDLNIQSLSLMTGLSSNDVIARNADEVFIQTQMILALKLFKAAVAGSGDENVLISPLSIQLALAMTANGADGETREEMEKLLGGNIPLEHLNEYLKTYMTNLPSTDKSKFNIANSIWFRDGFEVEKGFLQTNADYYGAAAYKSAFDNETVNDINNWVSENTDGMIDKILDRISDNSVMYLINALSFDAEWQEKYFESDVEEGIFTSVTGVRQTVEMMNSRETRCFVTDNAKGFFKAYKGGKYSFVGILPNEDITLDEYISSLDSTKLISLLNPKSSAIANVKLPKLSYKYEMTMNDALKEMGMPTAFDSVRANFSRLGQSAGGNIYISEVRHKTYICVGELGTMAGAATIVDMYDGSAPIVIPSIIIDITLNRPFLYMIVDNSTNLPIFIGTVNGIE